MNYPQMKVGHVRNHGKDTMAKDNEFKLFIGRQCPAAPDALYGNPYSLREYGRKGCLVKFGTDTSLYQLHLDLLTFAVKTKFKVIRLVCYCYEETDILKHDCHCHGDIIRDRYNGMLQVQANKRNKVNLYHNLREVAPSNGAYDFVYHNLTKLTQ